MTTPVDPLIAGDKLARPLNAPAAGNVSPGVQAGTSGAVVTANRVIIFGDNGELLVYSGTPAFGNLLASITGANSTDSFGNFVSAGITLYGAGGSAVQLYQIADDATVFLVPGGSTTVTNPGVLTTAVINPGLGTEQIVTVLSGGEENSLDDAGLQLFSESADGASAAAAAVFEFGGTRSFQFYKTGSMALLPLVALQPGTGSTPETWHQASPLLNSWAGGGGGVNGLFYRATPDGEVELIGDLVNTTATGNSVCFTIPSGYRPSVNLNLPCGWNNPATSNSASVPWLSMQTNGNVQLTGIEAANKEIFFSVRFPLGSL